MAATAACVVLEAPPGLGLAPRRCADDQALLRVPAPRPSGMASFTISTLAGRVLAEPPLDDATLHLLVVDLLNHLPLQDVAGGVPRLLLGARELGRSERLADLALAPGAVVTLVLVPEKAEDTCESPVWSRHMLLRCRHYLLKTKDGEDCAALPRTSPRPRPGDRCAAQPVRRVGAARCPPVAGPDDVDSCTSQLPAPAAGAPRPPTPLELQARAWKDRITEQNLVGAKRCFLMQAFARWRAQEKQSKCTFTRVMWWLRKHGFPDHGTWEDFSAGGAACHDDDEGCCSQSVCSSSASDGEAQRRHRRLREG